MRQRIKKPCSGHRIQNRDVHEQCAGCGRLHMDSELMPIGDGSIRVCRACYRIATAMVLTEVNAGVLQFSEPHMHV
jgi:hypothetical protein